MTCRFDLPLWPAAKGGKSKAITKYHLSLSPEFTIVYQPSPPNPAKRSLRFAKPKFLRLPNGYCHPSLGHRRFPV